MDLNFAEFLEEYVPIMPESVQDGVLKRMTYSEKPDENFVLHCIFASRPGTGSDCTGT